MLRTGQIWGGKELGVMWRGWMEMWDSFFKDDGRGISKEAPGMTALARWMEIGAGGGWLVWMELRAVGD